ncbi:MarR family winged helix-turn-helix transcriptional regulator [Nakamurella deserti]|uniref:MarR family winged helix-turn-helix transcriptional regulator n=1 Tax=Nakamurella deserti TaxID=2164074 RepID=UPI000DBE251B|nr:MarR family winged helix-turn-helix transcriptional regulator [Nakamurella deserti]
MTTPDERASWATGRLLSTAARLVEQSWNNRLRDSRVSHAGVIVLSLLAGGPATQRELAGSQHMTEQTAGRTIAHLEATGHLRRTADPRDRRRRVVEITDGGRALLAEMYTASESATDEVIAADGGDVAAFRAVLQRLIATYETSSPTAP